uniref:B12-binding domain-containing radical SAM protein n=1 Tax=Candidatus Borrarchaeum sp. TaxID=2846742 RepID=UPI00257F4729
MLINPPHTLVYPQLPQIGWPIGLAYIGGVLQKNGYDIKIYDALASNFLHSNYLGDNLIHFGESWEKITKIILKYSPDIVGISDPFVTQSPNAHKVAQLVKSVDPNIKTILGGSFAASMPKESIIDPNVDFVIMGEGEFRFLDLIKSLKKDNRFLNIDGLVYKDVNGQIRVNEIKGYIENLDTLPFPAIDLLNLENYFNATSKGKTKLRNINGKPVNLSSRKAIKYKWMSVVTSRGCPFNCFFCAIPSFWGRKWRARSPENVLEELRILIKNYGIEEIQFEDDNLTFNKRRIHRILDGIISERMDIIWTTPNGVRADTLDREILRKMKLAGCKELIIGVESGDQNVLNNVIGKKLNLQQVIKVAKICNELNMKLSAFYVTGLPGETEKTMKRTFDFASYLKRKYNVSIYMNYAIPLH